VINKTFKYKYPYLDLLINIGCYILLTICSYLVLIYPRGSMGPPPRPGPSGGPSGGFGGGPNGGPN